MYQFCSVYKAITTEMDFIAEDDFGGKPPFHCVVIFAVFIYLNNELFLLCTENNPLLILIIIKGVSSFRIGNQNHVFIIMSIFSLLNEILEIILFYKVFKLLEACSGSRL